MEEPSSSAPPGPPARQPSSSMLSIYLQRTASGQLTSQPSTTAEPQPRQEPPAQPSLAAPVQGGFSGGDPSPRQLQLQAPLQQGGTLSSPFYAHQPQGFLLSSSSIPISQRSSSQPVLSQSSTDPLPSSQPSRQATPFCSDFVCKLSFLQMHSLHWCFLTLGWPCCSFHSCT